MTKSLQVLRSKQDASVNFVQPAEGGGFFESRYVRRKPDYFIAYLSSQSACNRGCAFCHLTATGQTVPRDASGSEFVDQAIAVLDHYALARDTGRCATAKYVIFSLMARGEPLDSFQILQTADTTLAALGELAEGYKLSANFSVSTILPRTFKWSLRDVFRYIHPTIYYSLYSTRDEFRQRWMPGAASVAEALEKLVEWQDFSKKLVKIHYPLIADQNDKIHDAVAVCEALQASGLSFRFNLVRYNPPTPDSCEADDGARARYLKVVEDFFPGSTKTVTRVGFDVKASCGMFVEPAAE